MVVHVSIVKKGLAIADRNQPFVDDKLKNKASYFGSKTPSITWTIPLEAGIDVTIVAELFNIIFPSLILYNNNTCIH